MKRILFCLLLGFVLYYYNSSNFVKKMEIQQFRPQHGIVYIWEKNNPSPGCMTCWDFALPVTRIRKIEKKD